MKNTHNNIPAPTKEYSNHKSFSQIPTEILFLFVFILSEKTDDDFCLCIFYQIETLIDKILEILVKKILEIVIIFLL